MRAAALIPILAIAGVGLVAATAGAATSRPPRPGGHKWTGKPRDVAYAIAQEVESRYGTMPGLADYLDAVGYWESRWTADAFNPAVNATGMHQMTPGAAFRHRNGLVELRPEYREILVDPAKSTVLAIDFAQRGATRPFTKGTGETNWLAVRRWWRLPSLVHDFDEADPQSSMVRERFSKALDAVELPDDFMFQPVTNLDAYPGIQQVLSDLEIEL